ncbi:hypothetical protein CCACVL1_16286 [Corchorus capsularis]|uniref:TF-B3 domain-containing protein n=1 Tax=Corchorus capsularis TaxID=210143 RepID=A0A1R3HXX2_COCAP|nr:hypothetical protein CCACVL1_16286 [Corchorus capsularis]
MAETVKIYQKRKILSKLLSETDIKKRLAIPVKILPALPEFNGRHAVKFQVMYGNGTRMWPIVCSVRKHGGYKKPVISVGWRNFVICNGLEDKVGYELTLYKVQDELGTNFHYSIQVEKPNPVEVQEISNGTSSASNAPQLIKTKEESDIKIKPPFDLNEKPGGGSVAPGAGEALQMYLMNNPNEG